MSERSPGPDELPDDGRDDQPASGHTAEETRRPTPVTQQIGRIAVLVLFAVFIVFAFSNSQPVDFSWIVGDTQVTSAPGTDGTTGGVPLIVLLLVAFVIGALVGAMLVRTMKRRRARTAADRGR